MIPDELLPLDEGDVDARVRAGELVRLDVSGALLARPDVLEKLRARLALPRRGPRGTPRTGRGD
jgi:hypothetical protein